MNSYLPVGDLNQSKDQMLRVHYRPDERERKTETCAFRLSNRMRNRPMIDYSFSVLHEEHRWNETDVNRHLWLALTSHLMHRQLVRNHLNELTYEYYFFSSSSSSSLFSMCVYQSKICQVYRNDQYMAFAAVYFFIVCMALDDCSFYTSWSIRFGYQYGEKRLSKEKERK